MPLDKKYVSSSITELAGGSAWCARITYSYYALYNFTDVFVYKTQLECERRILIERCSNLIITDKNNSVIDIDPK